MGIEKCRLCCASKALISLTCGKSRKERDYIRKLTEITTGIKFQKNDASRYICVFCMSTIYNFHVFKIKSLRNEELLQSCVESPAKSTKKMKAHIPDLCEIELPSVEDLKTELFDWLKNKIDIMEKDEIENQSIDFDRFSTVSTQVDIPTAVMIDAQTQVEAPHTYNVSCQYSVKTTDEKIQCSILPVCHDKFSQTMKQSREIKENASQCNLYEKVSVSIGVQSSPVSNAVPSHSGNATVSATTELVETSLPVDQVTSDVNQNNGSTSEKQKEIGENVIEKSSSPRRRFSTRNKNNSPSTASLVNGLLAVASPSVENSQTLVSNAKTPCATTVHESVTKPTEATAYSSCDKTDSSVQSLESIGDTSLTKNRRKRKLSASFEGRKSQRKKVSHLGPSKKRISMPLPISSIKTEVPSEGEVEPEHTEMKFESGDTQLEPLEISTEALLYEIDSFLTPGTIKEECSASSPTGSSPHSKHSKTLSPGFKYDSPRSSRLLAVKDKVQFVKICKECDQPMYSEHERAKHRKSHMRCHLCHKVFTSLKKTKLHVSLECDKKISKLVPMVYLDRMDVSTLCAFSDEGSLADVVTVGCDDGVS